MDWFRPLSRLGQISCAVFLLHGSLVVALCMEHGVRSLLQKQVAVKPQKIAVRTVVEPQVPRAPERSVSKTIVAQKQPAKSAPKKKPEPNKQKAILQEIETSLAALSSKPVVSSNKPDIAVPIFSAPKAVVHTTETSSAQQQICCLLQEALQLPEFGEVKVALSIDQGGHLQSLTVLASKSAKNEEFLKNRLPQLQFPCLNEATSLTIVFSNAL